MTPTEGRRHFLNVLQQYGSYVVSEGTTRVQVIAPRALEVLRWLAPHVHTQLCCGLHPMPPSYALEDDDSEWWYSDACANFSVQVCDALNEHAPPGYYYGAHEADGACVGFWPTGEP